MPCVVCAGAILRCTFGALPSELIVLPKNRVTKDVRPIANIMDYIPIVNIPTFGMCEAPTNPEVIAQFGIPAPCVPVVEAPWRPVMPNINVGMVPVLVSESKTLCTWLGIITIEEPGQFTVNVEEN